MTLFRYVSRKALAALVTSLLGIVVMFLAIDFADNPGAVEAAGSLRTLLQLYLDKAAVIAYQTAPAALLLSAGITVSGMRATNEYTALRALGFGPWRIAVPVLALAFTAAVVLLGTHATVVVPAASRAERIAVERFGKTAAAEAPGTLWFRSPDGRRVYHLRGNLQGGGFQRVTVFELTPQFRVAARMDGERMRPLPDGAWTVENVSERTFDGQRRIDFREYRSKVFRFEEAAGAFAVLTRRPSDLRLSQLRAQTALRRNLGLASSDLELELYNRFAHPFSAVATATIALALALRRNRRSHISTTLLEAVGCSVVFWGLQGVFWALARNGRLAVPVAAWVPDMVFLAIGVVSIARQR